jgi:glycosyltransferase involved in cell wall biosynthesis
MSDEKNVNMNILILPKEQYPLTRTRLTELFMKKFCDQGNRIDWLLLADKKHFKDSAVVENCNSFHLVKQPSGNIAIGEFFSFFLRIGKRGRIKKLLRERDIDLILVNDGLIEGVVSYFVAKRMKKPFVFYLSSNFSSMDKHAYHSDRSLKKFVKMTWGMMKVPVRNWIIKRADIFHPISPEMGKHFKKLRKGKDSYPLPLCPSGEFIQKEYGSKHSLDDSIKLIYTGQVNPIRKMEFLLDIVSALKKKSEKKIHLVLVGKIQDQRYQKRLIKKMEELELGEEVEFVDEVPKEQVPKFIREANIGICILPPIEAYRMSSPTKIVEYLSLGIPVIGNSEIIDMKDVIRNSGGGYAPGYDIDEIVSSIIRLSKGDDKSRQMGIKGREWIMENRNYDRIARDLSSYYREYLAKNKA